jgi:hypothetical protein
MAGNILAKQGTSVTCVSSGSSLTSGSVVAANTVANLTNSTGLNFFAKALLTGGFGATPTDGSILSLYLVPTKLDGTNPATIGTSGIPPLQFLAGYFVAANQSGTQYLPIDGIPVYGVDYTPYLLNSTGQTLSSGWSLAFYPDLGQYT